MQLVHSHEIYDPDGEDTHFECLFQFRAAGSYLVRSSHHRQCRGWLPLPQIRFYTNKPRGRFAFVWITRYLTHDLKHPAEWPAAIPGFRLLMRALAEMLPSSSYHSSR